MSFQQILSILLPLIAFICSLLLFFVFFAAKKTMETFCLAAIQFCAIVWMIGSLLLHSNVWPSSEFWNHIAQTGMLLTPFFYIPLLSSSKERISPDCWVFGVGTLIFIVFSACNMFTPVSINANNAGVGAWLLNGPFTLPLLFLLAEFIYMYARCYRILPGVVLPLMPLCFYTLGMLSLILGIYIALIPALNDVGFHAIGCLAQSICILRVLQTRGVQLQKRQAHPVESYLIAIIFTTAIFSLVYVTLDQMLFIRSGAYTLAETTLLTMFGFAIAIAVFHALNAAQQSLFVRHKEENDLKLRMFANAVNKLLPPESVLSVFQTFLFDTLSVKQVNVYLYDKKEKHYRLVDEFGTHPGRVTFSEDAKLVSVLKEKGGALAYMDLLRLAPLCDELRQISRVSDNRDYSLILPLFSDITLTGILFITPEKKRPFSSSKTSFLETAASIFAIALRNCELYERMKEEARRDSLTGLYNRKYFTQKLEQEFHDSRAHSISAIFINLDDFRLYNELYGNTEGDIILQQIASIILEIISDKGTVARYGGKEFAISLPLCDGITAEALAMEIKYRFEASLSATADAGRKYITFSGGVCTYPSSATSLDQLISYANMAVYSVKHSGKNNVLTYKRSPSQPQSSSAMDKASIVQEYTSTIYALTAAIDAKDHYTFNHSQCVSAYAAQLAEAFGLSDEHVEIVRQAGLLHDIGKIGIPDSILTKEGWLSEEEMAIMRQHVDRSIEMIRHLPSLDYVIPLVLGHHERYDGLGYPRGLVGEDIPIGARCLAIVDSFDAMISRRTYKSTMPIETALNEIRKNLGKQFDPELGQLFITLISRQQIRVNLY